jgi:hypothetical protein
MFYDAVANTHGLPPTLQGSGRTAPDRLDLDARQERRVNLAPYSFFNAVSEDLHFVIFACRRTLGSPRRAIVNGRIDVNRLKPIARLGYGDHEVVDNVFTLKRPVASPEI